MRKLSVALIILFILYLPAYGEQNKASDFVAFFTLEDAIQTALKANIGLKISEEETKAALSGKKKQRSDFFPKLNTTYQYKYNNDEYKIQGFGIMTPQNEYTFAATITQPIFQGFALVDSYKISKFNYRLAQIKEKLVYQEVVFETKKAYFTVLKAQKLLTIAQDAVTQLTAHEKVAENFYQVGMTPLNDLLKAQVELANAKQDLIVAQNNLEFSESDFNIILRRPVNESVKVQDILTYESFEKDIAYCLDEAETNRMEQKAVELEVEIAKKALKLSKKNYYPSINLQGSYYKLGTDWNMQENEWMNDPDSWNVAAVASWDIWEWGKSYYGSKEKLSRLSQVQHKKTQISDNIKLEVKHAYLKTIESEKNIATVEKAVTQAKENLRISRERYKEQMDTSTDVLDAQTLLSKTMTNYYNSLYDFKISKAALQKAMGLVVLK